jgi:hypothetical protein
MRGLGPRHVFLPRQPKTWMAGTSPGTTPCERSIAHVMLPRAAVEAAGAQAAGLEICVRSRTGRGRCGRAFRSAPCRHGRCGRRGGRGSRRDNPRLRLRVTSKARQVVVVAIVWHDTPPWVGAGSVVIWQRGAAMSRSENAPRRSADAVSICELRRPTVGFASLNPPYKLNSFSALPCAMRSRSAALTGSCSRNARAATIDP